MFKLSHRIPSLIIIIVLLFASCKAKKKAVTYKKRDKTEKVVIATPKKDNPVAANPTPKEIVKPKETSRPKNNSSYAEIVTDYISEFSQIAQEEMLQYGIPASITLAQGILESGAGRGELSNKANNHFGIKCHKGWEGERVYHDDDRSQECFRKYVDPKYSYRDHSLFLTGRSRYQDLFKLNKEDYKGWARGLKKAGYATDPKYPNKLISIIERYDLQRYDNQTIGSSAKITNVDETKISTYIVKKGDTLYSISRKFNVAVSSLKEYNGLDDNTLSIGQQLYLHAVKN
ncbi:hemagglutinin [Patiriisocius marinistellae]|uniref:Peptidoglycan hydrolase n=1 Tax=Patiriisocius marinistellae TaxID=2494560 RepID=A0A5J4FUI2_9FLAO|nr:glucosaminidase domain-containing protein [Patiriisocius marinistellae]GEQ85530.1 hemagglutinin [Patiriisocius marinistellae]